MRRQHATKTGKTMGMKFLYIISGCPKGARKWYIQLFDMIYIAKRKEAENTVDKIRQKFGNSIITKGAIIDTDFGIYTAPKENKRKN